MAIPASGAFRASAIRNTFGGPQTFRLGSYRRDPNGPYVYANAANNPATNRAAAVTVTGVPLRLNVFRSQLPGWDYTNTTVRTNNFNISTGFGSNWSTNWPKTFTNNAAIGSTSTSTYACIISGGAGRVDFINNNEIQGAGGQPNGNPGQIALRITALTCTLYITNNDAIRGGGGAGGIGGTGGTGGRGTYTYTAQEGPFYQPPTYEFRGSQGGQNGIISIWWAGSLLYAQYAPPYSPITIGIYKYYAGTMVVPLPSNGGRFYVYRQWTATAFTNGGAGGAGGNGGRGIGYGSVNLGGSGGAGGAVGGTNAGRGGAGGTGGAGGSWGLPGADGARGATGATGNYTAGTAGAAGGTGGAGGYSIYADSPFHLPVRGTLNGPMGPTQPS